MNPLQWVYSFVTNVKGKTSHKLTAIILIILIIYLVDNVMGFSFHYEMNRRISELKEVNSIIQDPNADSVAKAYALELRAKIANRKIVTDYLRFRKTSSTSKIAQTSNPPATAKANDSIR